MAPFFKKRVGIQAEYYIGELLPDHHFKGILGTHEVDVLVAVYQPHDIAEINILPGKEIQVEIQLHGIAKADGVIGGEIEGCPVFLDDCMAIKIQSIRLGKQVRTREQQQKHN